MGIPTVNALTANDEKIRPRNDGYFRHLQLLS